MEQQPRRAPKLRYLDFVQVAAAQAAVYVAGLYGLAKDHAGPLRPGVDAVESTVKGVVGPVYARFGGLPLDVLAFVDRKVSRVACPITDPSSSSPSPAPSLARVAVKHDHGARGSARAWGRFHEPRRRPDPLPPCGARH